MLFFVLTNYLSILQLALPSLLLTSPHDVTTCDARHCRKTSACSQADRTASSWSPLSWLDDVGRDTRTFIFHLTAYMGGGETWVTGQILYNSDYCWNIEPFNTYFNAKISLTAVWTYQWSAKTLIATFYPGPTSLWLMRWVVQRE